MRKAHFGYLAALVLRLVAVMLLYSICRVLFYLFNTSYFSGVPLRAILRLSVHAVRFDLVPIVYINAPVILLSLFPIRARSMPAYRNMVKVLFFLGNSAFLLANCIDWIYFRFTLKRTAADIFDLLIAGNDVRILLPQFLQDFWYVPLLWLTLCLVLYVLYGRTERFIPAQVESPAVVYYPTQTALFLLSGVLSVYGARGVIHGKPLSLVSAGQYTSARLAPLLLNTPFAIIRTAGKQKLVERNYYSESELERRFSPVRPAASDSVRPLNVVLILLESFSRKYVGSLNQTAGATPFLDQLIRDGLVFTDAFANAKNSREGIPAVIAGLPSLMDKSIYSSAYGANQFTSLPNLLATQGYSTVFYHGARDGSMRFDVFSKIAGFADYRGLNAYQQSVGHERDFDGDWGIWDEEFLQYAVKQIGVQPRPLFATVFTLTSHHPYQIPEKYRARFDFETDKIARAIRYSDFALQRFFEEAVKTDWYRDTLFVITADHTAEQVGSDKESLVDAFAIPIVFYRPNAELRGTYDATFQQIDIMPTILDYLHFPRPYFAFGRSAFDTTSKRIAVGYLSGVYQVISENYVLQFDGEKTLGLWDFKTDRRFASDLKTQAVEVRTELEGQLKAFIQTYNYSLIHNRMTIDPARSTTAAIGLANTSVAPPFILTARKK